MVGWVPHVLCLGVVFPLNEVFISSALNLFCDNAVNYVNTHYRWLRLETVLRGEASVMNIRYWVGLREGLPYFSVLHDQHGKRSISCLLHTLSFLSFFINKTALVNCPWCETKKVMVHANESNDPSHCFVRFYR